MVSICECQAGPVANEYGRDALVALAHQADRGRRHRIGLIGHRDFQRTAENVGPSAIVEQRFEAEAADRDPDRAAPKRDTMAVGEDDAEPAQPMFLLETDCDVAG